MATVQNPSFSCSSLSSLSTYCSSKRKKPRHHQKLLKQKQIQEGNNGTASLSFKKPSPTPILIRQPLIHRTKLEALDAVVSDIETSARKGISVSDPEIFASLLETCCTLRAIDHGIRVHRLIPDNLSRKNLGISSKLVRLYASCGLTEIAHEVFDQMSKRKASAFAWNSLISGYTESGQYEDAMAMYFQMVEEGVKPDQFTFPRVLKACGRIGWIRIGEAVHRDLVKEGFGYDGFVLNALVNMYAKCGDIVKARRVFDKICLKDSVSWNSMLNGYIRHGLLHEAVEIFRLMVMDRFEPDAISISSILAGVSSFEHGCQLHGWAIRRGVEQELSVANALIVLYSKTGQLVRARRVFDHMLEKDTVSWNSIISAHSKDGRGLMYFEQMQSSNARPDGITFVSVLSLCANTGRVEEGERLFSLMTRKYGINPRMEHYACMVNLYGRAGMVKKAYSMIVHEMGFEAGPTVWGALLYACYIHGDSDIGEIAGKRLFELEPDNEHNFELMMKIYGKEKRAEDVERVRKMMVDRGL
ncbi:PREDICTED: pentatricopeptide repeat-containing protein At4g25270, chloroplastic [Tarenaya hassleriana]|uniref:pentatricopeptide repeat-containing protein At4g25270, chloroplastic n=1 Tax=Tarenaya hassleriana TaxID=28532 RepID=UPI00053C3DD7|nr:PREDICTED: pentatricopeptide repeat-containing protein At4g25270, chloroplastic [Tarenaya hassleriana]